MKFICLGYADQSKLSSMPKEEFEKIFEACLAFDDELVRGGHFVGGECLKPATEAVTLRQQGAKVEAVDGPYAETKEQIGGILILEARDLNQAIALMSRHPGVQLGPFEIRPADEEFAKMIEARRGAATVKSR